MIYIILYNWVNSGPIKYAGISTIIKFSFSTFSLPFQLSRSRRGLNDLVGGKKPYDEKQAEAQLQKTLDKLTEGEGPHYK